MFWGVWCALRDAITAETCRVTFFFDLGSSAPHYFRPQPPDLPTYLGPARGLRPARPTYLPRPPARSALTYQPLKSYHSRLTPASCGGTSTRARAFHTWNRADPPADRSAMTATRVQIVSSLLRSSLESSHFAPEYCGKSLISFPSCSSSLS